MNAEVRPIVELLRGRRIVALTGAGCSTESGIPDYRGPTAAPRDPRRTPMQYRSFVDDPAARARYWARSHVGWRRIAGARPNAAHFALAALERAGHLVGTVTQNVDGLHQAAGSARLIELHGALRRVVCLGCGAHEDRAAVQDRITRLNGPPPAVDGQADAELRPDGDAAVDPADGFVVPTCLQCGGVLKPDVVFFGENVPRATVDAAYAWLAEADAVLVVGSSLTVFSGYRFVLRAAERGLPVGIVNLGQTRGDAIAAVRVDAAAGAALQALAGALVVARGGSDRSGGSTSTRPVRN